MKKTDDGKRVVIKAKASNKPKDATLEKHNAPRPERSRRDDDGMTYNPFADFFKNKKWYARSCGCYHPQGIFAALSFSGAMLYSLGGKIFRPTSSLNTIYAHAKNRPRFQLKVSQFRSTRERNYVSDISHSCYVKQEAFKAQAETRMWDTSETAQVQKPLVRFYRQTELVNAS